MTFQEQNLQVWGSGLHNNCTSKRGCWSRNLFSFFILSQFQLCVCLIKDNTCVHFLYWNEWILKSLFPAIHYYRAVLIVFLTLGKYRCLLLLTLKNLHFCVGPEYEHMYLGYLRTDSSVQHIQKAHMPVFHSANGRCHG